MHYITLHLLIYLLACLVTYLLTYSWPTIKLCCWTCVPNVRHYMLCFSVF